MVIRRIGVWSVARLYGAVTAAMGLLMGAIIAVATMVGSMVSGMSDSPSPLGSGPFGAMLGIGAIVFLPLLYGVMGVIVGALSAALYNLFAGLFGGIQLDTEP